MRKNTYLQFYLMIQNSKLFFIRCISMRIKHTRFNKILHFKLKLIEKNNKFKSFSQTNSMFFLLFCLLPKLKALGILSILHFSNHTSLSFRSITIKPSFQTPFKSSIFLWQILLLIHSEYRRRRSLFLSKVKFNT